MLVKINLTLTSVVFELYLQKFENPPLDYLTLTSVVFEFTDIIAI